MGSDVDFVSGLTYANKANYQFRYGVTLKGHYQDLMSYKATGYSIDAGFIFQPMLDQEIFFGVMLQNVLGQLFWTDYSEDILSIYKAGISMKLFEEVLRINMDVIKEETYEDMIYRVGVEFKILEYLFLRGGIDERYPVAGAGIRYDAYKFDYAYTYDKYELGDVHQFSLVVMW